MLLKRLGFEVVPVRNTRDGLRLNRVLQPRAVLLNRDMSELDGTEVLKQLNDDHEVAGIPVVMVPETEKLEVEYECCALGYLTKPLTPLLLQETQLVILPQESEQRRRYLRCGYQRKVTLKGADVITEHYCRIAFRARHQRDSKPLPVGIRAEISLPPDNDEQFGRSGRVIDRKIFIRTRCVSNPGHPSLLALPGKKKSCCVTIYPACLPPT